MVANLLSYRKRVMTTNINQPIDQPCPCGAQHNSAPTCYQACCGRFHLSSERASSPEMLMRSRYTAFVINEYQYLLQTHHPDFLNGLTLEVLSDNPAVNWLSLDVLSSSMSENNGKVKFQAWYRDGDGIDAIHELSDFKRVNGIWLYTQGEQFPPIYPKRNDPCICHSGKKFKQCCLK